MRAAFGMTPIHPRGRAGGVPFPAAGAQVRFNITDAQAQRMQGQDPDSRSPSVPGSRASSPPIRLAPLKLPAPPSPEHRHAAVVGVRDLLNLEEPAAAPEHPPPQHERVELPRFSEVEAATGLR